MTEQLDETSEHESVEVLIPEEATFEALQLHFDQNGELLIDLTPIRQICQASDQQVIERFREDPQPWLMSLIYTLYNIHLQQGGQRSQDADALLVDRRSDQDGPTYLSDQIGTA